MAPSSLTRPIVNPFSPSVQTGRQTSYQKAATRKAHPLGLPGEPAPSASKRGKAKKDAGTVVPKEVLIALFPLHVSLALLIFCKC